MRRFGGDPAIVGRGFAMRRRDEHVRFEIVGVAEPRFDGVEPGRPTDVWLPYAMYNPRAFGNVRVQLVPHSRPAAGRRHGRAGAERRCTRPSRHFAARYAPRLDGPEMRSPEGLKRFLETPLYLRSAANGPSPLRQQFERSLWILASIAALVLLIAGSNVANLFLARTAAREREMALRLSIGAGRGRLIQQLLVESAIVAGAACVLGLLFAVAAGRRSWACSPHRTIRCSSILSSTGALLAFAGGLTLLTTALFGLMPAVSASGVSPITALKSGGGRQGTRIGVMRPFVAMQVAFGLIVLFVGSLLVLSFARLSSGESRLRHVGRAVAVAGDRPARGGD